VPVQDILNFTFTVSDVKCLSFMFMFTLELNTLTYILPTDALLYFIFCGFDGRTKYITYTCKPNNLASTSSSCMNNVRLLPYSLQLEHTNTNSLSGAPCWCFDARQSYPQSPFYCYVTITIFKGTRWCNLLTYGWIM
jgi:hypothetical protein